MNEKADLKGIINPFIFSLKGKKLFFSFYRTDKLITVYDLLLQKKAIGAFMTRGVYDNLIINLSNDRFGLKYLLRNVFSYLEEELIFEVTNYYKFEGALLNNVQPAVSAFDINHNYSSNLILACRNWKDDRLTDEQRNRMLSDKSIIKIREDYDLKEKGHRRTFVLINLTFSSEAEMRSFENYVINNLLHLDITFSFLKGQSISGLNFILEMLGNDYENDEIIWQLHQYAKREKMKLSTTTLSVQKTMADSYICGLNSPNINPSAYEILCKLPNESCFLNEIPPQLGEIEKYYLEIIDALDRIKHPDIMKTFRNVADQIVVAMFYAEINRFAEPFRTGVEYMTKMLLAPVLKYYGKDIKEINYIWKQLAMTQQDSENITFGQALKIFEEWHKKHAIRVLDEGHFRILKEAKECRNRLAHNQFNKISIKQVENAFKGLIHIVADKDQIYDGF